MSTFDHELTFPVSGHTRLELEAENATVAVHHVDTDEIRIVLHADAPFDPGLVTTSAAEGVVRVAVPALTAADTPAGPGLSWGRIKSAFGIGAHVTVDVWAPEGTGLAIDVEGGDVTLTGRSGPVHVSTGGGDVRVERAEDLRLRTGGGDLRVGVATGADLATSGGDIVAESLGPARVSSTGGDIRIEYLAEGTVSTGGGDIHVSRCGGPVDAQAGGGDVTLQHCSGSTSVRTAAGDIHAGLDDGSLNVRTGAGDVTVVVPRDVPVWQNLDSALGEVQSRIDKRGAPAEGQKFVQVTARTGTGDITLTS